MKPIKRGLIKFITECFIIGLPPHIFLYIYYLVEKEDPGILNAVLAFYFFVIILHINDIDEIVDKITDRLISLRKI